MKRNNFIVALSAFMCTVLLSAVLSACSVPDNESDTGEDDAAFEEDFAPAKDKGEDSESGKKHAEYTENVSLAFKGYAPADSSAFEYESADGQIRLNKYIGTEPIIVVPETIDSLPVKTIASSCFSGGKVGAVYIPDTVDVIEKTAFDGCGGLEVLRLPVIGDGKDDQYIGYIFGADEPMDNAVSIPASLETVIIGSRCTSVSGEAFRGAKTIGSVVFEGEIDSIGNMAFYQCTGLVHITLDKAVGNIGELAFASCSSLYYADISNSKVEDGAFYLCTGLNGIKLELSDGEYLGRLFGAQSPDFNDEFVPTSLRSVIVGDKTEKISDRAFTSCKYLTEITFSKTVRTVGVRAFYACRSLSEIKLPEGLKLIDDDAFFGCDNLKTVEFGSALERIGMQAFYGCISLEKANVGDSTAVGKNAFGNCPKLNETK